MTNGMDRLVLFVLDGVGSDDIDSKQPQAISKLADDGVRLNAQSASPDAALAAHYSLLYSIDASNYPSASPRTFVNSHSSACLFEVLRNNDIATAMYFGWDVLRQAVPFESMDEYHFINASTTDDDQPDVRLVQQATEHVRQTPNSVTFVYYSYLDTVGHTAGWATDAFNQALHRADDVIGKMVDQLPDTTSVILTSYHGGYTNGDKQTAKTQVPIIINGPTIGSKNATGPINMKDVSPTILGLLNLRVPNDWQGNAIDLT